MFFYSIFVFLIFFFEKSIIGHSRRSVEAAKKKVEIGSELSQMSTNRFSDGLCGFFLPNQALLRINFLDTFAQLGQSLLRALKIDRKPKLVV